MIYDFLGKTPSISTSAFIAPSAEVIGDVTIGENSSIWFQCLIRGDVNYIKIGDNVNIQDMSLIHVARDVYPVNIGNNVSLGHRVTLHGCTLKDFSFVGMCATVMDDVEIGEYSFVAAGSLVTPGKKFPPGVMIMGSPAKIIRDINEKEREIITRTANNYVKYKDNYKQMKLETIR
ncbi:gamma carbonic anhydrase family protein [Leptospira sp. GIMC2001]|uniref:gamma carbonic anhydrase family protein n=1 Tax=Leptospira sp. GIMC2001 TaxID=1513297 RepID=UPI00234BDA2C|nr:gamma carbonic anhydrase family protein [Leptospira sp. GIMC2001]WCL50617.1 gamma carbonic anhydrase family protein [Leptospira sp. GIMC2001]